MALRALVAALFVAAAVVTGDNAVVLEPNDLIQADRSFVGNKLTRELACSDCMANGNCNDFDRPSGAQGNWPSTLERNDVRCWVGKCKALVPKGTNEVRNDPSMYCWACHNGTEMEPCFSEPARGQDPSQNNTQDNSSPTDLLQAVPPAGGNDYDSRPVPDNPNPAKTIANPANTPTSGQAGTGATESSGREGAQINAGGQGDTDESPSNNFDTCAEACHHCENRGCDVMAYSVVDDVSTYGTPQTCFYAECNGGDKYDVAGMTAGSTSNGWCWACDWQASDTPAQTYVKCDACSGYERHIPGVTASPVPVALNLAQTPLSPSPTQSPLPATSASPSTSYANIPIPPPAPLTDRSNIFPDRTDIVNAATADPAPPTRQDVAAAETAPQEQQDQNQQQQQQQPAADALQPEPPLEMLSNM